MQNTRRWHFAGDLYFDLALYIQQLTVPTVMYGANRRNYQRQPGTAAGAVEPAIRAIGDRRRWGAASSGAARVVIGLLQKYGLTVSVSRLTVNHAGNQTIRWLQVHQP